MRKFSFALVTMLLVMLYATVAFATGGTTAQTADMKLQADGARKDSLPNANQTGQDELNKAVHGQKVHGSYQNNTNSCASCHQTHTGSGPRLLFKRSDYEACVTCHDGTMGYFNVFATDMNANLGSGTFGGTHEGMSVHLANDSLEVHAAPGATPAVTEAGWGSEFSCVSCHDPHGSYSDRLLTNNPNDMAKVERVVNASQQWFYGNKISDLPVIDGTSLVDKAARDALIKTWSTTANPYDSVTAMFKAVKFKLTDADVASGGQYFDLGLNAGNWVIQLYKLDNTAATVAWIPAPYMQNGGSSGDAIDLAKGTEDDPANDINGQGFGDPITNKDTNTNGIWKNPTSNSKRGTKPGWQVNGAKGYVAFGNAAALAKAVYGSVDDIAAAITYVTNVGFVQETNLPMKPTAKETTSTGVPIYQTDLSKIVNANAGNGYNYFCASCHTAYLSGGGEHYYDEVAPGGNAPSVGEEAPIPTIAGVGFRHHAMDKSYTCARCHYAHGTDATWMLDANGSTYDELVAGGMAPAAALDYMTDVNPSSALKRYTNMSVCYGCHTSSHSTVIVGSGNYATDGAQINSIDVTGKKSLFKNNYNVNGKVTETTGANF